MPRTITAGMDGSPESLTAAEWAAREALLREVFLRLVHALRRQPFMNASLGGMPKDRDARSRWADHMLREAEARIARHHPGLRIDTDRVSDEPLPALLAGQRCGASDREAGTAEGRDGLSWTVIRPCRARRRRLAECR
ncbi:universal stress protein [Streptomyces sp. NPDC054783]